jgi:hypothetical protein
MFLSGGQSEEEATLNLSAINRMVSLQCWQGSGCVASVGDACVGLLVVCGKRTSVWAQHCVRQVHLFLYSVRLS